MGSIKAGTAMLVALLLGAGLATTACGGGAAMSGGTVAGSVDDATLSTRVKTALLNEPDLGALRIDVNTEDGVVNLVGTVSTPGEEQRAVAVAKGIRGVRDVRSSLKVEQP